MSEKNNKEWLKAKDRRKAAMHEAGQATVTVITSLVDGKFPTVTNKFNHPKTDELCETEILALGATAWVEDTDTGIEASCQFLGMNWPQTSESIKCAIGVAGTVATSLTTGLVQTWGDLQDDPTDFLTLSTFSLSALSDTDLAILHARNDILDHWENRFYRFSETDIETITDSWPERGEAIETAFKILIEHNKLFDAIYKELLDSGSVTAYQVAEMAVKYSGIKPLPSFLPSTL